MDYSATTKLKSKVKASSLSKKAWIPKSLRLFLLIFMSFVMVYPLLWMMSNSFKSVDAIMGNPASLLPTLVSFENFRGAFDMAPFDLYILNSIFTAVVIVFFQLILSALLAYALVFFSFPGKKLLLGGILLTYMLPSAATYVPSYVILAKLNLLDSLTGLIVSNLASVFSVFLLYQTFRNIPKEMMDAAKIDGATHGQILWKIVFPYTKSTFLTTALIGFVTMYNNYMWPSLITTSKSKMLISVGLNTFFTSQGNFAENLPRLMAANTIAVVPLLVLFIVLQKWFIRGISDSGIKG